MKKRERATEPTTRAEAMRVLSARAAAGEREAGVVLRFFSDPDRARRQAEWLEQYRKGRS